MADPTYMKTILQAQIKARMITQTQYEDLLSKVQVGIIKARVIPQRSDDINIPEHKWGLPQWDPQDVDTPTSENGTSNLQDVGRYLSKQPNQSGEVDFLLDINDGAGAVWYLAKSVTDPDGVVLGGKGMEPPANLEELLANQPLPPNHPTVLHRNAKGETVTMPEK